MEWISVNDKLPITDKASQTSDFVLCFIPVDKINGGSFQRTLYYDASLKMWKLNYKTPVVWNITHWMPLPEPPKN